MNKGNAIWALSLCLILGACASSGEPTQTTAPEAAVPPLIARMRALEAEVGAVATKKVWSAQLTGNSEVVAAWLDGSTLLIEALNTATHEYEVYSVDVAKNGRTNWMIVLGKDRLARAPHIGRRLAKAGTKVQTGRDTIAFLTENNGAMVFVDAKTGSRIGNLISKIGVVPATDANSGDHTLYLGNYLTERFTALSGADGGKGWDIATTGICSTTPLIPSSASLAREMVIGATDKGSVFAVLAKEFDEIAPGTAEWTRQLAAPVSATPLLYEAAATEKTPAVSMVVVPCEDGNLYALESATGRTKWVLRTNAAFKQTPVTSGGWIFARNTERFFAIDPMTGDRVWWAEGQEKRGEYEKKQLFFDVKSFEDLDRALAANGDKVYAMRGQSTVVRLNAKDGSVVGGSQLTSFDHILSNNATGTLVVGTKDGIFMAFE